MKSEQKLIALRAIRQAGKLTRQDLAHQLQISLSQATKVAAELIARKRIYETGKIEAGNSGRPADWLALVPDAAHAVGVHISNTRQIAVVTNVYGEVVARLIEPVLITEDRDAIITSIRKTVEHVILTSGVPDSSIAGVGVALSDIVDPVARVSYGWPDTPGWAAAWTNFPVGEALASVLQYSHIQVDDIVRALGVAEARYGRGTEDSDFVYVLIDQGVGMAIMMNGIPYIGYSHIAGEIAHIPVGPSTEPCSCGNVGCLRNLTGVPVVLSWIRRGLEESPIYSTLRSGRDELNIDAVLEAANEGDKLAIQVLTETGENLGKALAVVVNLLGPHSFVLGGALARSASFVDAARRSMKMHALVIAGHNVAVETSGLDEFGGARGAATQVLDALFDSGENNLLDFSTSIRVQQE